tara:strand:- start:819 stop:1112 length:294 start_codon:yes stop_codon:yes gene_type:complete
MIVVGCTPRWMGLSIELMFYERRYVPKKEVLVVEDDRGPSDLTRQIDELKQKVHDAELETSLIKAVGMNSPEMKALQQRVKELEAQLKLKEMRESGL